MITFKQLKKIIADAYTAGDMKRSLWWAGVSQPMNLTQMYLNGEPYDYIATACLTCDQIGA